MSTQQKPMEEHDDLGDAETPTAGGTEAEQAEELMAALSGLVKAEPVEVVMTDEVAAKLRAPFRPEQIGLLPKPTNKDNAKGNCEVCGKYHGLPAVHLDYVGHAACTDRLLQVDPNWTWRPMAVDPNGHPIFDTHGGLWILLTVAGVTRPGYGDQQGGKGSKEIIGDALRNAAMRFGVALDLWSKEDLHPSGDVDDQAPGQTRSLPEYDAGAVLVPGAPAGWKDILDVMEAVDSARDWQQIVASILEVKYKVATVKDLDGEEQSAVGKRTANLAAYLQIHLMEGKEFPPPNDSELVEAIQWAFDGLTLEPPFPEKEAGDAALSPEAQAQMKAAALDEAAAEAALAEEAS